ncbi:MAG: hypothetical protein ACUVQ5_02115 [Candidatus Methanomethylicaceae archaeon]
MATLPNSYRRDSQIIEDAMKFIREEASRCIQCNEPNCISGCPYGLNVPVLLLLASSGDFEKSRSLLEMPPLLDLSRSCLTERPCERSCTLIKKGKPIQIHQIEILLIKNYKKV